MKVPVIKITANTEGDKQYFEIAKYLCLEDARAVCLAAEYEFHYVRRKVSTVNALITIEAGVPMAVVRNRMRNC